MSVTTYQIAGRSPFPIITDFLAYAIERQTMKTKIETDADATRNEVGIGMCIAAGILMSGWGEDTMAAEIIGAANLDTIDKMRAAGVDEYDIDLLRPVTEHLESQRQARTIRRQRAAGEVRHG